MAAYSEVAVALGSGISLVGLAWLFLWLYPDYRRDLLRARLFTVRSKLFDGATEGRIDFDHPAYGLLRSTLNGLLRFGHRLGSLRLIGMAFFIDSEKCLEVYDFSKRWRETTAELDPETKKWLSGLLVEMHDAIARHVLVTSVVGVIVSFLWFVYRRRRGDGDHHVGLPKPLTNRIDSAALAHAA